MLAGHDTVSMGVGWTLYALARNPEVERRLRTELRQMASDTPTMDELNTLTYLDWVVREALRLYAPVPYIVKVATLDTELPLSKPFIDTSGREVNSIRMRKGQGLFMSITAMNKRKELYGEDACEFRYGHPGMRIRAFYSTRRESVFRPERWENPPTSTANPTAYSSMMTFTGGPHACIGYRFAVMELKAIVFTLVRAFSFELAFEVDDLRTRTSVVQRPYLASEPEKGSQFPFIVQRAPDS